MTENKKTDNFNSQEEEKEGKKRWLLLLLLLLLLFLLVIGILLRHNRGRNGTSTSGDTPLKPNIEANAESIAGDTSGEKLSAPDGGGAVSLNYSKQVDVDLSAKKASLVFANPSKSNQDAVLQLIIQDTVIIQSGSLAPGTRVTTLDLSDDAAAKLTAGTYDGKFTVSFYDRATDRWATLNAEIPVTVTVTK